MTRAPNPQSGGRILVDALRAHGIDTAFCVPGESYLPVLDALYEDRDAIRLITCRHEGGAAFMAEAYAKATGTPGVCFVTRGPGSTNASIGIHTARQDSTALVVFVGQVARDALHREAWQEIDYGQMFGRLAKWVVQIDDVKRIPELVSRAFHVSVSGRPGPVVVALPEDMLGETADVVQARPFHRVQYWPSPSSMQRLREMLISAQRPMVVVGGGAWTPEASVLVTAFADSWNLPVACGYRRQDLVDNRHPNFVGQAGLGMDPRLAARVSTADLILAIGPRLGETSTNGYTLLSIPEPVQQLVHVHRDAEELGRVYRPALAIHAGMREFGEALAGLAPPGALRWEQWTADARRDYENHLQHSPMPGPVDLGEVMRHLRDVLPPDSIICNGAGNYTLWVQRFYQYRGIRTQLAPTSGTMGYGLPASVAAKLAYPRRTVVCFAGDGCFLMNGQELATAVQYGLDIVVIVINNSRYGSIRMHQEKHYPGRPYASDLKNPDFVELARAYGAFAERVTSTSEFPAALQRALNAGRPALMELPLDSEVISPQATITSLRSTSSSDTGQRTGTTGHAR